MYNDTSKEPFYSIRKISESTYWDLINSFPCTSDFYDIKNSFPTELTEESEQMVESLINKSHDSNI